jgi:hypothetical protein
VHTAVVEFNALTDPVRSTTEDDDFLFIRLTGFIFVAVRRIKIWGVSLELSGASVYEAVTGNDALRLAFGTDLVFCGTFGESDLAIGETEFFCSFQVDFREVLTFFRDLL